MPKTPSAAAVLTLLAAFWLPLSVAATERFDEGAWSAAIPGNPDEPCELTTGGYDRTADEQNPMLLLAIARDGPAPTLRVNVITVTELTQAELLRARAELVVDGPSARTLALIPAAIVQTDVERRVTFRALPGGGEQAGLRAVVDAMRRAERVTVKINGLPLEPAFSMQGLDVVWQRASSACVPRR
ncbi:hypothetical protein [Thiohalocapsa sp.]|jgi:hypothetical protein|uniref:hypothetical protein n=1 Tax=Thiohalocapsa sp. TaxID=2497641 RepID=UPI0025F24BCA|nr:hypothetical protein [Thiohalocapsa sp.]